MKTKIFIYFFILTNLIYSKDEFFDDLSNKNSIKLSTSIINSDYLEGEKLQGSKSIIVIDKKEIEGKGYTSVSEVLDKVPSITVGKTGWGEIDIRGQGADQANKNLQVMIDGAPITTLINHPFQTNYNVVPIDQIERIEIIPGGGSVLYGNGASGGVINISTNLKKLDKPNTGFGYEYFNNNKKRYHLNIGNKIFDNLSFQLNYSQGDENLYFVDTYFKSKYFSSGFNYILNDDHTFSFKYSSLKEDGQFIKNVTKENILKYGKKYKPNFTNTTVGIDENGDRIQIRKRRYLTSDRESQVYNGSYIYKKDNNFKIIFDLFSEDGYFTNNSEEDKKMTQNTNGIKTKVDYTYNSLGSILLGIDYYKQKAKLTYPDFIRKKDKNGRYIKNKFGRYVYTSRELRFDYERDVNAIYFLNKFNFDNFEFTQGIRQDITKWSFSKNAADGDGKDDRKTTNYAYELSSAWLYRDSGRVYARYERGFTGPDGLQISDRIYNSKGERVYRKTKAEDEIFNIYEIGVRDKIFNSVFNFTTFYTSTNNQLNRLSVKNDKNQLEYRTLNLLATERYGIEMSLLQTFGKFTFEEGYSWLNGKTKYNSKGKKFIEDKNKIDWEDSGLKKVPEHNLIFKMGYQITNSLYTDITYKYSGGYNNYFKASERESDTLVKSNSIVDLSVSYSLIDYGLSLYGGINNLFNENYYSYVGDSFSTVIPANGRVFYSGFKYKL